jgi:Calx-beta domain-containing protein
MLRRLVIGSALVAGVWTAGGPASAAAQTVSVSISGSRVVESNAGSRAVVFRFRLSRAVSRPVTVFYATRERSARSGRDFRPRSGAVTLSPGRTTMEQVVRARGDLVDEPVEHFELHLLRLRLGRARRSDRSPPPQLRFGKRVALGGIIDDDPTPTIAVSDVRVLEGFARVSNAVFTLTLAKASEHVIRLRAVTAGGTATPGADYLKREVEVVFLPGQRTKVVEVQVPDDQDDEDDETFGLELSNVEHASFSDGMGVATIQDDDVLPRLSIDDVTVTEGDTGTVAANFTVSLDKPSGLPVTVSFRTADGTATVGSDYQNATGTITFAPGEVSKRITVLINGDTVDEPVLETVRVLLSNSANATVFRGEGFGHIADDDP